MPLKIKRPNSDLGNGRQFQQIMTSAAALAGFTPFQTWEDRAFSPDP
jgi:hypothetical protein